MRISKPKERWFPVPEDPDNARVKIRQISPGERNKIIDKAFSQEIDYVTDDSGNMVPKVHHVTNRQVDREETVKACVVDWESFFDEKGNVLKCTLENVVRALNEIDGFFEHVSECRKKMSEDIAHEDEEQEKN